MLCLGAGLIPVGSLNPKPNFCILNIKRRKRKRKRNFHPCKSWFVCYFELKIILLEFLFRVNLFIEIRDINICFLWLWIFFVFENAVILKVFVNNADIMQLYWPKYPNLRATCIYAGIVATLKPILLGEKSHKMHLSHPDEGPENALFLSPVQCTFV